jgi:hypothetical protein
MRAIFSIIAIFLFTLVSAQVTFQQLPEITSTPGFTALNVERVTMAGEDRFIVYGTHGDTLEARVSVPGSTAVERHVFPTLLTGEYTRCAYFELNGSSYIVAATQYLLNTTTRYSGQVFNFETGQEVAAGQIFQITDESDWEGGESHTYSHIGMSVIPRSEEQILILLRLYCQYYSWYHSEAFHSSGFYTYCATLSGTTIESIGEVEGGAQIIPTSYPNHGWYNTDCHGGGRGLSRSQNIGVYFQSASDLSDIRLFSYSGDTEYDIPHLLSVNQPIGMEKVIFLNLCDYPTYVRSIQCASPTDGTLWRIEDNVNGSYQTGPATYVVSDNGTECVFFFSKDGTSESWNYEIRHLSNGRLDGSGTTAFTNLTEISMLSDGKPVFFVPLTNGWQPWTISNVTVDNEDVVAPRTMTITATNSPNPFNPETTISYSLPETGKARISVFNLRGEMVRSWDCGVQAAGEHSVNWNGRDGHGRLMSSGVYAYRIECGANTIVSKMVMMK